MLMTGQACTVCTRPAPDAWVCRDCLDTLHGDLVALPDLARDLVVELTNQSRKGRRVGGRSSESRLPYSPHASELLTALRVELVGACRVVALHDDQLPADTVDAMCQWLDGHLDSLALREAAGDVCTGLRRVRQRITRAIDTPPERVFIGDCGVCDAAGRLTPMYAARSDVAYHCRECGTTHDVAECIEGLERFLADFRLTAAEVEVATGGRVKAKRVHQWVARSRISRDDEGKVRFGDVLALEA